MVTLPTVAMTDVAVNVCEFNTPENVCIFKATLEMS